MDVDIDEAGLELTLTGSEGASKEVDRCCLFLICFSGDRADVSFHSKSGNSAMLIHFEQKQEEAAPEWYSK
jgi:hypothetical protein